MISEPATLHMQTSRREVCLSWARSSQDVCYVESFKELVAWKNCQLFFYSKRIILL